MPRVSEAHLAARRQQILDAGRACFARNGFHATSMQDVIAEAGLSVGAFYRYFRGKDELVEAIAEQAVGRILNVIGPITEMEPAPGLPEALEIIVEGLEPHATREGTFGMAIQVWAESLRSPAQERLVKEIYGRLGVLMRRIVERSAEAGHLPPGTDVDAVATVMFSLVPGFALQRVLLGGLDSDTYIRGVRACFAQAPDSGGGSEMTQKRLPSVSARTTKSGSSG